MTLALPAGGVRPGLRLGRGALAAPALGWLALFLLLPCGLLLVRSLALTDPWSGATDWSALTLENFQRALQAPYRGILLNSARIAALSTLIALVIAWPAAYAITLCRPALQTRLLFLVMLPFWTSYLIRTYAWMVLLNREGLLNAGLMRLGLISTPLDLLYGEGAVILGLVYGYLPFVILAIYASLSRIDPALLEAARILGAGDLRILRTVLLPLSLPGIGAGAVFIFVLSIGNFVTPALLGGGKLQMIGTLVYDQYFKARDYSFGSALASLLVLAMLLLLLIQALLAGRAAERLRVRP